MTNPSSRHGARSPSQGPRGRSASPESVAHAGPALWQQLQWVAAGLQSIRAGQSGTTAVEQAPAAWRAGVQALLFAVLRQLGRAEALRSQLVQRKPPAAADALLCSALALAWNPEGAAYEPHTLVNQTIEAAKRGAARGQAAFLNACLRRFLRERDALVAATESDLVARWNHPAWWIARLQADHPDVWERILAANNEPGPMTLRVNVKKGSVAQYQQALGAINLGAERTGDAGLILEQPVPVHRLPGFEQGSASVQDAAAQMAAPLLLQGLDGLEGPRPLRVLDACAAPGGKTAHLLEMAPAGGLDVTALEVDGVRAERIHQNLQRLGLRATVVVADAGDTTQWFPAWQEAQGKDVLFDAILLDAPCTASGIVRRHPDVRWLRRESDIAQLAAQQARLLKALWPLLQPGGRLLYCTCSVFRAEGEGQVQTFLAHNTDACLLPAPGHLIPGRDDKAGAVPDNQARDHDGFYYALLQKKHP